VRRQLLAACAMVAAFPVYVIVANWLWSAVLG
jgi:hypothetical protein